MPDNNYIKIRDALYNCAHASERGCDLCPYHGKENCQSLMQNDAYELLGELYRKIEITKRFIKEINIT